MSPRFPAWLLARCLPPDREDVRGDLEEVYRADLVRSGRWRADLRYWREALVIAATLGIERLRDGIRSRRSAQRRPSLRIPGLEIRLGLRLIRKQPVLTLAVVLALSVGIGLATAGFTLLKGVMVGRLSFDHEGRFVQVALREEGRYVRPAVEHLRLFHEDAQTLTASGAFAMREVNLIHRDGTPEPMAAAFLTPEAFATLPVVPVLGRTLTAEDGLAGAAPTALISEAVWRRLGGTDAMLGELVTLGAVPRRVVGVLPTSFAFPLAVDVWIPITEADLAMPDGWLGRSLRIFGVLSPGTDRGAATAELQVLTARADKTTGAEVPRLVEVVAYTRGFGSDGSTGFLAAVVVVLVLVLLVAATNVANLILTRTAARSTELAVRTALGARRSRLIAQIIVEVGLLGLPSALVGLVLSQVALQWGRAQLDSGVPPWISFTPDAAVGAFILALLAATILVAGLLPAWRVTRTPPAMLLSTGAGRASVRFGRLSGGLIIAQLGLSLAFLVGAGVMVRGLIGVTADRTNLPSHGVVTARIYFEPPPGSERDRDKRGPAEAAGVDRMAVTQARVSEAVRSLPEIADLGIATVLPQTDGRDVPVEWETVLGDTLGVGRVQSASVTPGFFSVLGVLASAGRLLEDGDGVTGAPRVAVVNERFVDRQLHGKNPIGRRFRVPSPAGGAPEAAPWITIVGVVPDLGFSPADPTRAAGFYEPLHTTNNLLILARTGSSARALEDKFRRAVFTVDPEIRVTDVLPLGDVGWESRALLRGLGSSFILMGAMSLLLSLISVYAIMAFFVTQRTREIGIRIALGATRERVLRLVLARGARQIALGMLLGGVLAVAFGKALTVLPIHIPVGDPLMLAAAFLLVAGSGLVACWVPARRSVAIRPTEALRCD